MAAKKYEALEIKINLKDTLDSLMASDKKRTRTCKDSQLGKIRGREGLPKAR